MGTIHPKVKWAALFGTAATAVVGGTAALGINLPSWAGAMIALVSSVIGGYAASSPPATTTALPSGGSITEVPHG